MANEAYIAVGTPILFNGEGGASVAFAMEGVVNGAGRVSAQRDLGAAPRPYLYRWSAEVLMQATAAQGAVVEFYAAGAPDSDATQVDGDVGQVSAALGDADMRRNLKFIGSVVVEEAGDTSKLVASGIFEHFSRYISIVGYNATGATVHGTAANFRFDLQPITLQGQ